MTEESVTIRVRDRQDVPVLSIVLGYGPMLPFVAGAILAWVGPAAWRPVTVVATILWGCAILTFLAGVRRGVSFRMPDGPHVAQIATMFWLFCLGLAALGALVFLTPFAALVPLLLGYASVGVLDPIAARHGEAPGFFAKLRPYQMAIPVVCLLSLLAVTG